MGHCRARGRGTAWAIFVNGTEESILDGGAQGDAVTVGHLMNRFGSDSRPMLAGISPSAGPRALPFVSRPALRRHRQRPVRSRAVRSSRHHRSCSRTLRPKATPGPATRRGAK
jgi:hypothetical protein